jgi:hypothetical protein
VATLAGTHHHTQPFLHVGRARLLTAATVLLGVFFMGMGTSWDIHWHATVGRESFWIPPHLVLYAGTILAVGGAVAGLALVWLDREAGGLRARASVGLWVTAVGALWFLASAPFDDLWHRLYGIDVTIWSPPHLSLIAAACTMVFGTLLLLLQARRRVRVAPTSQLERGLTLGLIVVALTFLLQPPLLATLPAIRYSYAQPGVLGIWLLPALLVVLLAPVLFLGAAVLGGSRGIVLPVLCQLALRPIGVAFAQLGYALVFPLGIPAGGGIILGVTGASVAYAQSVVAFLPVAPVLGAAGVMLLARARLGERAWLAAAATYGAAVAVEGMFVPMLFGGSRAPVVEGVFAVLVLALVALPAAWGGWWAGRRLCAWDDRTAP